MDLDSYRRTKGRGAIRRLAEGAGLAPARLYEILRGHTPTVKTARKIEAASHGEVTAAEVLGVDTPQTIATDDPASIPERGRGAA